ncbi:hypothetical protein RIF29_35119 [Crotalaria pallida]|uniref:Uncharacterized protein n=1 Tax=Crotalaria pallida TaxID=3830 RepID=A0AAN9EFC3_CROPI
MLYQKSILRDAVSALSLRCLAKAKILVIEDDEINAGINATKVRITNILEENVVQPLLVSTSTITLATECVPMNLMIDDIVAVR